MNAEYINAMDDSTFVDTILLPQLEQAGCPAVRASHTDAWWNLLASIVRPRTKMPADAVSVSAPRLRDRQDARL